MDYHSVWVYGQTLLLHTILPRESRPSRRLHAALRLNIGQTSVTYLLPIKKQPEDEQLVGFNLSLPMGFVYSMPYFCVVAEMIANLATDSMESIHTVPPHDLEEAASTRVPSD